MSLATTAPTRPVLRYHGGKWRLAPWIIAHFPAHRVYVEPYGGAASVLLQKPRSYGEVYNDLWDRVVDVFRVLRDPVLAGELARRLALTPFARAEFDAVTPAAFETDDIIERARLTITRAYGGHGALAVDETQNTGFRSASMRSETYPAAEWAGYPQQIAAFAARFRGVVVENRPALEVMQGFDGVDTLHYVDPPYMHATRAGMKRGDRKQYRHEMTDADHAELIAALGGLRGMVVLSAYASPLYESRLTGWQRVETRARADGGRERTEVLWLNRAAAASAPQSSLFDEVQGARVDA